MCNKAPKEKKDMDKGRVQRSFRLPTYLPVLHPTHMDACTRVIIIEDQKKEYLKVLPSCYKVL
jgi:hypothetical protein